MLKPTPLSMSVSTVVAQAGSPLPLPSVLMEETTTVAVVAVVTEVEALVAVLEAEALVAAPVAEAVEAHHTDIHVKNHTK